MSAVRAKKWSKKRWALVIFLTVMVPVQFLNNTGFCYSEMRYVPERELVDRFLFSRKWLDMTEAEKAQKIAGMGEDYERCCRVDGEP